MKRFTKIGLKLWLFSIGILLLCFLLGLALESMGINIGGIERLKGETLLCFDISGSMLGVLDEFSSELGFFLRIVPPGTPLGLRTFGLVTRATKLEVPVSPRSRKKIKKWLEGEKYEAGGGTPMAEALTASIQDYGKKARHKNLLLVTDGEPNNIEKTCEAAKLVKKKGIKLFYILVVEEYQNIENLERIAEECGDGKLIVIRARDFGHWLQLALGNYFYFLVILLITILTVYASFHQARFFSHLLPLYIPRKIPLTIVNVLSYIFWISFTLVILIGLFHIIGFKLGLILIAASTLTIVIIGLFTNRL